MKLSQLYEYLNYIRRKDPMGDTISPPEFSLNCQVVAYKFFSKLFGLTGQYQKGARDPISGYGLNQVSDEKIRPLKVKPTSVTVDANGETDYPANYFRHSACYRLYVPGGSAANYNVMIPFVSDAKFEEMRITKLDPPSLKRPWATLGSDKLRFLPTDVATVYLSYIKTPAEPELGYVIDNDTAETVLVERGAYVQVTAAGSAGDFITLYNGITSFGTYVVVEGDSASDVMIGLAAAINVGTLSHGIRAVYDGEKVVLIDNTLVYTTLSSIVTGGNVITKTDFSAWTTEFDWENDSECMNEIADMLLDQMGISNRDVTLIQWAAKNEAK